MKNHIKTSRKVASNASKQLHNKSSSKSQKSVAAFALGNRRKK